MKIIRIHLPNKILRVEPFTVKDYINLLLIRKEIESNPSDAEEIIDGLLEDLYPLEEKSFRPYIFLHVFSVSIGKTVLPIQYKCPVCKKNKRYPLDLNLNKLEPPVLETAGIKIEFNYIDKSSNDIYELFESCVNTVSDSNNTYKWAQLSQDNKDKILSVITIEDFESLIKKIHPIFIELDLSCCQETKIVYRNMLDIFKIILSDEELISMYTINHMLTKYGYSISDTLALTPMERTITLALVEKDLKSKQA